MLFSVAFSLSLCFSVSSSLSLSLYLYLSVSLCLFLSLSLSLSLSSSLLPAGLFVARQALSCLLTLDSSAHLLSLVPVDKVVATLQ